MHDTLYVIPVNDDILKCASEAFPTTLGPLDAIHLASALVVRSGAELERFLTHDRRLATAAASTGFVVEGV